MSFSSDLRAPAGEYVGVIRLANCYIATHVQENQKKFISAHPETDIRIAQATAKAFAEANKIFYYAALQDPCQPILTVLKYEGKWFPAELHAEKVTLLRSFGPLDLGGSKEDAIHMAGIIALSRNGDSIPSIGISLAN